MGAVNPKNLLLLPLIIEDKVLGVLEIASMNIFEDYVVEFLERITQSLAIAVASSRIGNMENEGRGLFEEVELFGN